MFLKSIVLRGFKTFAEKTTLDFSQSRICAIVGPNGCGKSNIVDSFRFVLGETNFRQLRVTSLPEVIFAGTKTRSPLSLADVSIALDNYNNVLPIPYSEVSVRRRAFRDGESEFLINNQGCRLKDIRSLFWDTGISSESLIIMGQGRVDAILSSHPEERRAVFEEIAGINKYKHRKSEAERKLILVEQHLLRIADLLTEIKGRMEILEDQADKARRYQEYVKDLNNLQAGILKKQYLSLKKKIDILKGEISQQKEKNQLVQQKKQESIGEKETINNRILEIEGELEQNFDLLSTFSSTFREEINSSVLSIERDISQCRNSLRDEEERERFSGYEINQIKMSIEEIKTREQDLSKRFDGLEPEDSDDITLTGEFSRLIDRLINILDYLFISLELSGIKKRFSAQEDKKVLKIFEDERLVLAKRKEALLDSLKAKEDSMAETNRKIEEIRKSLADREKKKEEMLKAKSEKEKEEKKKIHEKIEALKKEKGERVNQLKKLDEELNLKSEDLTFSLEISLAKLEGEFEKIMEQINDEYGDKGEDFVLSQEEVPNLVKGKKTIEELRGKIRELEPVNLLAIKEFEETKERFYFLQSQHDDLLESCNNLKTLISLLDTKARDDFMDVLDIISKNFSEVFSQLFEGGEAKIELEKDRDILSAGIEITVRPKNRRWLSLSLLSGGERALTAIAILFAILKTKPVPFAVLDEVDAPLDESNILRFAKFLKRFSEQTQILIITHNKRTMEVADAIYGVTMEEPGVSKIVSMKLNKVLVE